MKMLWVVCQKHMHENMYLAVYSIILLPIHSKKKLVNLIEILVTVVAK